MNASGNGSTVTAMRKVALEELSRDVRSFLAQVRKGKGILVEDGTGRARYGVIPYVAAAPAEKKKAWKDIERIQRKVGRMMRKTGKTEVEFDRLLQDDEN